MNKDFLKEFGSKFTRKDRVIVQKTPAETLTELLDLLEEAPECWMKSEIGGATWVKRDYGYTYDTLDTDRSAPMFWDFIDPGAWTLQEMAGCLHGLTSFIMNGRFGYLSNGHVEACPVEIALSDAIKELHGDTVVPDGDGLRKLLSSPTLSENDRIVLFNDHETTTLDDIKVVIKHAIVSEQMKDGD